MKKINVTETDIWTYISNTANTETIKKVKKWKTSLDYDKILFKEITNIYKHTYKKNIDKKRILLAKKHFFDSINKKEKEQPLWKNILKYIAIITLVLSSSFYYFYSKQDYTIHIKTTFREQKQIPLSDGSVVWLNASSSLSYQKGKPRTLFLIGEAFFKVTKDKKHPFTVTTPDHILITALGTRFNVKSYKENKYTETILLTGKVSVTHKKEIPLFLNPNEKATFFAKNNNLVKSSIKNSTTNIAWREGKTAFNNKFFKDIALDLKLQHNTYIIFKNKQIAHTKFTGSFSKKTSVKKILETLQLTKHFNYEFKNNEWIIK